ncbi:hypothetical protein MPSEU_000879400 [Mayamaea pseudoterrestris]|nr:hypothetical protein MPSEU_000879400 [Mayamaea pseudoterrestris]
MRNSRSNSITIRCWSMLVLLFSIILLLESSTFTSAATRDSKRPIQIINDGGNTFVVEVYWVNPQTKEEVRMSDPHVLPGTEFKLESYVGHEFSVREKPSLQDNGACKNADKVCRHVFFTVSENDDQIARLSADFELIFEDNKIKARQQATDLLQECRSKADAKMKQLASNTTAETDAILKDLVACVQTGVASKLEEVHEEMAFQSSVRTNIAATLENYTCADDSLDSTPDLSTTQWIHKGGNRHTVHVKHDRPSSKIHVIENFIDEEECIAMELEAQASLHRATVADGKGGSRLSENRKAMQAGIKVPWDQEEAGHAIARLSRRVYDYANAVLHLGIEEHGQEDLMSIQYEGRGVGDAEPDRYTPHCDGDCTGLPHKSGSRMATMVMYCTVADRGGHTNFRNAGVHVKPQVGDAIFFSYINPESLIMDYGFTEHSGCPVYEGHKKIVTQWIRLGVDLENPWDSFNTLGIKLSEIEKLESGLLEDVEEDVGNDSLDNMDAALDDDAELESDDDGLNLGIDEDNIAFAGGETLS